MALHKRIGLDTEKKGEKHDQESSGLPVTSILSMVLAN